jgi:hypothetical protein
MLAVLLQEQLLSCERFSINKLDLNNPEQSVKELKQKLDTDI